MYQKNSYQIAWFLTLSYTMVLVMANWFDARLVQIFSLVTDAGTLIFPLTFLLSDAITEVYGYKYARRTIWVGFLFNLLFLGYGQLVIHLPSPSFYVHNNELFHELLSTSSRIILASFSSYLIAEPLNSYFLAKLKIKMNGRWMSMRFVASTVCAAALDSTIFSLIAFSGTMSGHDLFVLITTMWGIKVVIEILGIPISTRLCRKLKEYEKVDMYDTNTNFTLLSLNTQYSDKQNRF